MGGATTLAKGDFQAAADATAVATLSAAAAGQWSEGALSSSALPLIDKTGKNQFRVYFTLDDNDDLGNDYLIYATGSARAASTRPQLIIKHLLP